MKRGEIIKHFWEDIGGGKGREEEIDVISGLI